MISVAYTMGPRLSRHASKITRARLFSSPLLPTQPPSDVLDVDDRVVDEGGEGHHQAGDDHQVDGYLSRAYRTVIATMADTTTARLLMSAVRQLKSSAPSAAIISTTPISSAEERFSPTSSR